MFEFNWPWVFVLLPLPVLVWYFFPAHAENQQAALRVPFIEDFSYLSELAGGKQNKRVLSAVLLALCWILLLLATARPQWVGDALQLPVSGRDLMMAVDLSGSMQEQDFSINGETVDRLTATKYVASDFIDKRKGDRLGLILFGRNAYLQTPLTFDLKTVKTLLLESVIGLAGKETAIGDAIGLAIKRLKDNKDSSKVLILLTDGANTAGEVTPLKAADMAAKYGLKIYTIGIGADEMIQETFFGRRRINPSRDLDEKTLTAIAQKTGGEYFRARDTEALKKIYQKLDQLEPVQVDTKTFRPVKALFMWPLSLALLISGWLVIDRRILR
jgi:Ca-activated chloride channel homolog